MFSMSVCVLDPFDGASSIAIAWLSSTIFYGFELRYVSGIAL